MDLKGRVSERGLQNPGIAKIGLLPKCPDIGFVLRQAFLLTSLEEYQNLSVTLSVTLPLYPSRYHFIRHVTTSPGCELH